MLFFFVCFTCWHLSCSHKINLFDLIDLIIMAEKVTSSYFYGNKTYDVYLNASENIIIIIALMHLVIFDISRRILQNFEIQHVLLFVQN